MLGRDPVPALAGSTADRSTDRRKHIYQICRLICAQSQQKEENMFAVQTCRYELKTNRAEEVSHVIL